MTTTNETIEKIYQKFENANIFSIYYPGNEAFCKELEEFENLLLYLAYSFLGVDCYNMLSLKKELNRIAYKYNFASKATFPELDLLNKEFTILHEQIKQLKQGIRGEYDADVVLAGLPYPARILRNIYLKFEHLSCECDRIVITPKGIFVIEVKNNRKNMLISPEGEYKPVLPDKSFNTTNIGDSMNIRKFLISRALSEDFAHVDNIPIEPLLLFINNDASIDDQYQQFKVCSGKDITYYILNEYPAYVDMTLEEMEEIETTINNFSKNSHYKSPYDPSKIEQLFSVVISKLKILTELPEQPSADKCVFSVPLITEESDIPEKKRFIDEFTKEFTTLMTAELDKPELLPIKENPPLSEKKTKRKVMSLTPEKKDKLLQILKQLRTNSKSVDPLAYSEDSNPVHCRESDYGSSHDTINTTATSYTSSKASESHVNKSNTKYTRNSKNKSFDFDFLDLTNVVSIILGIASMTITTGLFLGGSSNKR